MSARCPSPTPLLTDYQHPAYDPSYELTKLAPFDSHIPSLLGENDPHYYDDRVDDVFDSASSSSLAAAAAPSAHHHHEASINQPYSSQPSPDVSTPLPDYRPSLLSHIHHRSLTHSLSSLPASPSFSAQSLSQSSLSPSSISAHTSVFSELHNPASRFSSRIDYIRTLSGSVARYECLTPKSASFSAADRDEPAPLPSPLHSPMQALTNAPSYNYQQHETNQRSSSSSPQTSSSTSTTIVIQPRPPSSRRPSQHTSIDATSFSTPMQQAANMHTTLTPAASMTPYQPSHTSPTSAYSHARSFSLPISTSSFAHTSSSPSSSSSSNAAHNMATSPPTNSLISPVKTPRIRLLKRHDSLHATPHDSPTSPPSSSSSSSSFTPSSPSIISSSPPTSIISSPSFSNATSNTISTTPRQDMMHFNGRNHTFHSSPHSNTVAPSSSSSSSTGSSHPALHQHKTFVISRTKTQTSSQI